MQEAGENVIDGGSEKHTIDAVENAAVPWHDRAGIFDVGDAFEEGLEEVSDLSEESSDQSREDQRPEWLVAKEKQTQDEPGNSRAAQAAEAALDGLFRAHGFEKLSFPED